MRISRIAAVMAILRTGLPRADEAPYADSRGAMEGKMACSSTSQSSSDGTARPGALALFRISAVS